MTFCIPGYMSDKTASTEMAAILASSSRKNSTEFSQSSSEIQAAEATCFRNQAPKAKTANRAEMAHTLRAIAHLLMSGSLGLLIAFSCEFRQQTNESYSTPPEQGQSERL